MISAEDKSYLNDAVTCYCSSNQAFTSEIIASALFTQ